MVHIAIWIAILVPRLKLSCVVFQLFSGVHYLSFALEAMAGKKPTPLILHVETSAIQSKAFLVGSSFFDDVGFDATTDSSMIWCAGLLNGRSSIPAAGAMRQALGPSCDVQYYQPRHDDNPTKFGDVNLDGVDESSEGAWCTVFTAPDLVNLANTFDSFFSIYMGIGQPIKDNFFYHAQPAHRYISRKNFVNGRRWETRYTIRLQMQGYVTMLVSSFIQRMLRQHPWLQFSGAYLSDPMKLLGPSFKCDCTTAEAATAKWQSFQASKLNQSATAASIAPGAPSALPGSIAPRTPPSSLKNNPVEAMSPVKGEAPSATPGLPFHAFPDWSKQTPAWPGTNAWPKEFPPLPPALDQQEAIESENDKDDQTIHNKTIVSVKHDDPQQGSVSPTQLDVEQDGMEPEAKRAKVFQETLDIQKHDDVFSMEEHNTFMEPLKGFWSALQSNLSDPLQFLINNRISHR